MSCPLCRRRRGRRLCPAKGESICSACCGSKRLVEIDCPPDCVYLTGVHAAGWDGNVTQKRRDAASMAPHLQGLSDVQLRLFFLTLVGVVGLRRTHRELDDAMLLQVVAALRKTVETRERGVLYDHPAENLRAQALLPELRRLFESRDEEGRVLAPDDSDLVTVLKAVEDSLAGQAADGEGPTAFLDRAQRLVGAQSAPAAATAPTRIIEP